MEVIKAVPAMQKYADEQRCAGKKIALVPTMGALHEGHLSLVKKAREVADCVVVSIFVNPTQFGPKEDFGSYPRMQEEDLAKLRPLNVDAVFAPGVEDMYPRSEKAQRAWVTIEKLDQQLCGRYRDGHFLGVTTVVTKLFNACKPDVGVFGLKDAQQFLILRRMSEDLNMGVKLVGVPTYREDDGLAASSRNLYLTPEQRAQAPCLNQGLQLGKKAIDAGERDASKVLKGIRSHIEEHSEGKIQYIEIVDTDEIQPVLDLDNEKEVLIALAVFFGKTRLIDNVFVTI